MMKDSETTDNDELKNIISISDQRDFAIDMTRLSRKHGMVYDRGQRNFVLVKLREDRTDGAYLVEGSNNVYYSITRLEEELEECRKKIKECNEKLSQAYDPKTDSTSFDKIKLRHDLHDASVLQKYLENKIEEVKNQIERVEQRELFEIPFMDAKKIIECIEYAAAWDKTGQVYYQLKDWVQKREAQLEQNTEEREQSQELDLLLELVGPGFSLVKLPTVPVDNGGNVQSVFNAPAQVLSETLADLKSIYKPDTLTKKRIELKEKLRECLIKKAQACDQLYKYNNSDNSEKIWEESETLLEEVKKEYKKYHEMREESLNKW